MNRTAIVLQKLIWAGFLLLPGVLIAAEVRIAAASNFAPAMKELVAQYSSKTGHEVRLSFGSTGKHYAQIVNGAPFDAFFAADAARPERLEAEGRTVPGSLFTYARGKLVLWSARSDLVDSEGLVLKEGIYRHLAIANPRLAPYGEAARQALLELGLWDGLGSRLVRGENIGQAFQFVRSGNAELGLIAWSQLVAADLTTEGSLWIVPASLYHPINQQAVQLTDTDAVQKFMSFVRSESGSQIIQKYGYDIPDAD